MKNNNILIEESNSNEQNEEKLNFLLSDTIKKPTKLQMRKASKQKKGLSSLDLIKKHKFVILEFPIVTKY